MTRSRAALDDRGRSSQGTSVYDAMREGVELVGDEGSRSLLVLSDGADTGSDSTLDVATNDAIDAGVVVDVVSLGSRGQGRGPDHASPTDTGGAVIPADPAALGSVFTAQADALAEQLSSRSTPPTGVDGEATITVSAEAGGTPTSTPPS